MPYQPFNTLTGVLNTSNGLIYNVRQPQGTSFPIIFYNSTAEENRVDKSSYLTTVTTLSGTLKEQCSILKPSIVIAVDSLPVFNYCYIAAFNRYYFVTEITSINTGLWRIDMEVDVLMTYKTGIGELNAIIGRSETYYDAWLIDNELPVAKGLISKRQVILGTPFTRAIAGSPHNFVLVVNGKSAGS